MMSALEREIIEKFHQLDHEAKLRVLEEMQQEVKPEQMSLSQVLAQADAVRITLQPDADGHIPTAATA